MNEIYQKNINIINLRFPHIYAELEKVASDESYFKVEKSKNSEYDVPILKNGKAVHSKYSNLKESEKMFSSNEETVLFCGIGAAFHIQYFLNNFPKKKALICEASYPSLKSLLKICNLADVLQNEDVVLLEAITDSRWETSILNNYLPHLMGSLSIKVLRAWKDYFFVENDNVLDAKIRHVLDIIKQDVATQARFGKIWMRNILLNLKVAGTVHSKLPKVDNKKTAYILGAGPSLDFAFEEIKAKRERIVLFASDASFMPLLKHEIVPDFFISIDPQIVCSTHCILNFPNSITAIFDLSASCTLVRHFLNNGNQLIFTTSQHPLVQYARSFSTFPQLEIGGGTVAIAALKVAFSLGFSKFEYRGMDFAYTNGAAYTRGVYLSASWAHSIGRLHPEECHFVELMFRGDVEKYKTEEGITYKTKLLNSYREAFFSSIKDVKVWTEGDFSIFPYNDFAESFKKNIECFYNSKHAMFLPFIMWEMAHKTKTTGFFLKWMEELI